MYDGKCIALFSESQRDNCAALCGAYQATMLCVEDQVIVMVCWSGVNPFALLFSFTHLLTNSTSIHSFLLPPADFHSHFIGAQ